MNKICENCKWFYNNGGDCDSEFDYFCPLKNDGNCEEFELNKQEG